MEVILPLVTALLGGIAALGASYLTFRSQLEKIRLDAQAESRQIVANATKIAAEARAAERDDGRDDFLAIVREQKETIKRLEERVATLEREREADRIERNRLRSENVEFLLTNRLLRRAVLTECRGVECPLWRLLDDKERAEMLASLTASENGKRGQG